MANLFSRYYGSFGPSTGAFTVSVDGSTPERLNGKGDLYLDQRMLWSNASLGPGRHTVTLTNDDAAPDTKFSLDFFRLVVSSVKQDNKGETTDSTYLSLLLPLVVKHPPRKRRVCAAFDFLAHGHNRLDHEFYSVRNGHGSGRSHQYNENSPASGRLDAGPSRDSNCCPWQCLVPTPSREKKKKRACLSRRTLRFSIHRSCDDTSRPARRLIARPQEPSTYSNV